MNIVICGGGGFIGQRLSRLLLGKGHEIVMLDRNASRVRSPKLDFHVVDLLETGLFHKAWFSGAAYHLKIASGCPNKPGHLC